MKNLKFRMWDGENSTFEHDLSITDCQCDGNVEYQQFTGFKDFNHKEIYCGDILRWEETQSWEIGGTIQGIYIVQWDEKRGQWMLYDPFDDSQWEMHDTRYEGVIGNIFENESLLPCEDEVD